VLIDNEIISGSQLQYKQGIGEFHGCQRGLGNGKTTYKSK
jgi:hypothetical protein